MHRFVRPLVACLFGAFGVLAQGANADKGNAKELGKISGTLTTEVRLRTRGAQSTAELIAYLVPKKKAVFSGKGKRVEVTQKRLQFRPRALPVLAGTEVVFLNQDRVTHNVFIDSLCCGVDQDAKKGEKVARSFPKAGAFPVVCRLHPEMKMTVLVLETPYFASCKWRKSKTKNERGKTFYQTQFAIENVPAGTYTLRTWNQKLGSVDHKVVIAAGKSVDVALAMSK